jgi:hypothetical protein
MKSILLYKILNDYTAPNLKEWMIGSSLTQANYNLRNSYTDLSLPKRRREFLKKGFKYSGAKLRNTLSREAKEAQSQPRTQDLSLGKTLASAGHVTPIKNCSRGRVGEFRIYN